jgi:hypothetical protein
MSPFADTEPDCYLNSSHHRDISHAQENKEYPLAQMARILASKVSFHVKQHKFNQKDIR